MRGCLVDPIPNSPNSHHINCTADSKENYFEILRINGLKENHEVRNKYSQIQTNTF